MKVKMKVTSQSRVRNDGNQQREVELEDSGKEGEGRMEGLYRKTLGSRLLQKELLFQVII
jgi:hypothetical protein